MKERELKELRLQLLIERSLVEQIDDWGFAHRIRSRATAIRELCKLGMSASAKAEEGASAGQ